MQNYQFVASDDDFGGLEKTNPNQDLMKKIGANLPTEGPPIVKDQTFYR